EIIEKKQLLQQIIANKYPYFFIDEYQDTDPLVVEIMQILHSSSKQNNYNFFVGYFGDEKQNIYNNGIGDQVEQRHSNLVKIEKKINRRSSQKIIDVINAIRNDDMEQNCLYDDASKGSVHFYYGQKKETENFINKFKYNWKINPENPLNCLVLTNRSVAEYIGISGLYQAFRRTELYSGSRYARLNEELLSKDYDKLGDLQKALFQLFHLITIIENKNRTANNILVNPNIKNDMTLQDLNEMIDELDNIKGNSLLEILQSIDELYQKSGEKRRFEKLIVYTLHLDEGLYFRFEKYFSFLTNS